MSSITGTWSTLSVNMPDFTRYARSPNGQFVQLPAMPIIFTICGVIGIVTTSAAQVFTGETLWNPLDIITLWLDGGSGGRAAAFFAALAVSSLIYSSIPRIPFFFFFFFIPLSFRSRIPTSTTLRNSNSQWAAVPSPPIIELTRPVMP